MAGFTDRPRFSRMFIEFWLTRTTVQPLLSFTATTTKRMIAIQTKCPVALLTPTERPIPVPDLLIYLGLFIVQTWPTNVPMANAAGSTTVAFPANFAIP